MISRHFRDKDAVIKDFIKDAQKILKENLISGYLFGSYSRSEQTPESDIDLLFIVRKLDTNLRTELSSLASDYSLERDVIISPILKDIQVWEKNRIYDTLFYQEVTKDGIKLC